MFRVWRTQGPVRKLTDDYLREQLEPLSTEEKWQAFIPLTRLGRALGWLGAEVEVDEDVPLLGIPAGRITVQRLFYSYFCTAYYQEFSLDELDHINYDWYAPKNGHRQTPEEVRACCEAAGLDVEREQLQESGITIVARKR